VSVETGNFEVIKCLIEHQETVQSETGLLHVVNPKKTVKKRNFLKVCDKVGNTPLHLDVAAGNTNNVSSLVSAGSDLNTCNVQGDYPYPLVARCGKNDIVKLLLEREVEYNEAKIGALRTFVVAGDLDATDLLLRSGIPVNIGVNEKTIHVASRFEREEIFRLLLKKGANLTFRTYT
jgi:ankyrin repeat protein